MDIAPAEEVGLNITVGAPVEGEGGWIVDGGTTSEEVSTENVAPEVDVSRLTWTVSPAAIGGLGAGGGPLALAGAQKFRLDVLAVPCTSPTVRVTTS